MIKKLLIGASALALTTTVAHAAPAATNLVISDDNTAVSTLSPNFETAVRTANNPPSPSQASNAASAMPNATQVITPVLTSVISQDAQLSNLNTGNKGAIEQDGGKNTAEVNQDGGAAGWGVVNQRGANNYGTISQVDDVVSGVNAGTANGAYISQVSALGDTTPNTQYATIVQDHTGGLGGQNAAIVQGKSATANGRGSNNYATIQQTGGSTGGTIQQALAVQVESGNTATIVQSGESNQATSHQVKNGDSGISQIGNQNQAYVSQTGGVEFKLSRVFQTGNGNFAAVSQTLDADSLIVQNGDNNESYVDQNASFASSTIEQRGLGGGNFASVYQVGAKDLTSSILQGGAGGSNDAWVYQHNAAGSAAVITQGGQLGANVGIVRQ